MKILLLLLILIARSLGKPLGIRWKERGRNKVQMRIEELSSQKLSRILQRRMTVK